MNKLILSTIVLSSIIIACNNEGVNDLASSSDLSIILENNYFFDQNENALIYKIINKTDNKLELKDSKFKLQITSNNDGRTKYIPVDHLYETFRISGNDTIKYGLDMKLLKNPVNNLGGSCSIKIILETNNKENRDNTIGSNIVIMNINDKLSYNK